MLVDVRFWWKMNWRQSVIDMCCIGRMCTANSLTIFHNELNNFYFTQTAEIVHFDMTANRNECSCCQQKQQIEINTQKVLW